MKWNWRKLAFGSGAVIATFSTVYAFSPKLKENESMIEITGFAKHGKLHAPLKTAFAQAQRKGDKETLLQEAIHKSRMLCKRVKNEMGLPGLTVGVSINGKMVWQEGFGFANLENNVRMQPENIMRIASISKSMTMAMLAKLMEEGKIDIDKPIQTYLPTYPEKYVDGEKVTITTRHLLSHLSGIRHYEKKGEKGKGEENCNNPTDANVAEKDKSKDGKKGDKDKANKKKKKEMELAEYFLKDKFSSMEDAMKLFQDDELFHKPGTKFLYSTHAWTVVSAIIEKLTETEFTKYSKRMFDFWGLKNTTIDIHEPIIYNRASYYTRFKDGEIINAPYVDNSYKWAGGGFLSTVADLNQFANILLYSMQTPEEISSKCEKGLPKVPFLKQSTIKTVWTGNPVTARPEVPDFLYALGFVIGEPLRKCMFCKERDWMTVHHSGAAVGASSIMFMGFPPPNTANSTTKSSNCCDTIELGEVTTKKPDVNGVVVSMITNLTSIGLTRTAQEIANYFKDLL